MANTSTSSMDQLVASGMDPKTAEALKNFVYEVVEVADRSRQREAARRPALKESIGWTGIIAIATVIGIQLGAIYWLNNSMRAGFESVNEEFGRVYEEFGRVRNEISDLRNHTLAEIGSIRSEVGVLRSEVGKLGSEVGVLRSEVGVLRSEVGVLRSEVGELRSEVGVLGAEVGVLRSEVGKLDERMIGYEMLIQDWMSSVTAKLAE